MLCLKHLPNLVAAHKLSQLNCRGNVSRNIVNVSSGRKIHTQKVPSKIVEKRNFYSNLYHEISAENRSNIKVHASHPWINNTHRTELSSRHRCWSIMHLFWPELAGISFNPVRDIQRFERNYYCMWGWWSAGIENRIEFSSAPFLCSIWNFNKPESAFTIDLIIG